MKGIVKLDLKNGLYVASSRSMTGALRGLGGGVGTGRRLRAIGGEGSVLVSGKVL